jgi:hypothetical protein
MERWDNFNTAAPLPPGGKPSAQQAVRTPHTPGAESCPSLMASPSTQGALSGGSEAPAVPMNTHCHLRRHRDVQPLSVLLPGDARARQGWRHADGEAEADDGPLVVLETLERNVTRDRGDACCCAAANNVVVLGTDHGAVLRYDFAEGGAYGADPPRST